MSERDSLYHSVVYLLGGGVCSYAWNKVYNTVADNLDNKVLKLVEERLLRVMNQNVFTVLNTTTWMIGNEALKYIDRYQEEQYE